MIEYDPGTFGIAFVFRLRGSVFPKGVMWALPSAVLAVVFHMYMPEELSLEGVDEIWSGYTFVLGFLIVFRNSQAYSRFWEGATLIQQTRGEWFNAVSSLFAFCSQAEEKKDKVTEFQNLLVRLMSMLYCQALQQICELKDDSLEIIDISGLDTDSLRFLTGTSDRCEVVLQWLQRAIVDATEQGIITVAPPILSRAYQELSRGIVNLNNVRKIKDVPFPFPYAQMITVMLMVHFVMTPLIAAHFIQQSWWAGAMSFLVTCAFWSLVYIAGEIDHPFGEDANDFNIAEMQQAMNSSLITLLQPLAQKPPKISNCELNVVRSDMVILGTAEVEHKRKQRQSQSLSRLRSGSSFFGSEPDVVHTRVRRLSEVMDAVTMQVTPRTQCNFQDSQDGDSEANCSGSQPGTCSKELDGSNSGGTLTPVHKDHPTSGFSAFITAAKDTEESTAPSLDGVPPAGFAIRGEKCEDAKPKGPGQVRVPPLRLPLQGSCSTGLIALGGGTGSEIACIAEATEIDSSEASAGSISSIPLGQPLKPREPQEDKLAIEGRVASTLGTRLRPIQSQQVFVDELFLTSDLPKPVGSETILSAIKMRSPPNAAMPPAEQQQSQEGSDAGITQFRSTTCSSSTFAVSAAGSAPSSSGGGGGGRGVAATNDGGGMAELDHDGCCAAASIGPSGRSPMQASQATLTNSSWDGESRSVCPL